MKKLPSRIAAAFLSLLLVTMQVFAADYLVPVGEVIGLELASGSVSVAAFDDAFPAARDAGLRIGDEIVSIDGMPVTSGADVRRALVRSNGSVELCVSRGGKESRLRVAPEITADGPRLGVYLRQGITGIGTVTWFDPDTGAFGTLGHGVSDGKGALLPMMSGRVYPASVVSVRKGKSGKPGQLKGALDGSRLLGTLSSNTEKGVFGTAPGAWHGSAVPVASFSELHTGQAVIRCAVSDGAPRDYSVEILKIYPKSRTNGRDLLIRVTDPELLKTTGGIVQGMSGSPILQDGKLIGAVTHVLVNQPDTGYGIFIENMLDAAG